MTTSDPLTIEVSRSPHKIRVVLKDKLGKALVSKTYDLAKTPRVRYFKKEDLVKHFCDGVLDVVSFGQFGCRKLRPPKWRALTWRDDLKNIRSDFEAFETGIINARQRLLAENTKVEG